MKFIIKYLYPEDERKYGVFIESSVIEDPLNISWEFLQLKYYLNWDKENRPHMVLLNEDFVLTLYYKDNLKYSHPNNLVVYNLKKEIIKIVTIPEPIHKHGFDKKMTMNSIKDQIVFNNKFYLPVYIQYDDNWGHRLFSETRYLDIETWEFHPTKYEFEIISTIR